MAVRRNVRLRKEFLYRKSLEGKEREEYERKERIRRALAEGKPIPTELRREAGKLKKHLDAEDDATAVQRSHIDDEYASAGWRDPKVCVTTSRAPSSRLKQFAKEVKLIFPNAQRINRGATGVDELVDACRAADFTDIIVLQETRGEPDAMIVSHLPFGPTVFFTLSNTVMRHDIEGRGTVSEAFPHLIFHNFKTPLGERIKSVLQHLFPVPKDDSHRVITFANTSDHISFRHHVYRRDKDDDDDKGKDGGAAGGGGAKKKDAARPEDTEAEAAAARSGSDIELSEVGPRFEMMPFQVRLGTLDQTEAEVEWVLRPYMNTAKKREAL